MMSKQKAVDPVMIGSISRDIFLVLPLLKKHILHVDSIQNLHGIPFSHVQVLSILEETGAMSVSEISVRLGIAKPNITPMVDRLIVHQYVKRVRDTKDRRIVNIIILEKGQKKLQAIQQTIGAQITEWAESITDIDFQELTESLQNISRILSQVG